MTSAQKFLLLSSIVSYLMVLYGFLTAQPWILLICFILHSLLLIIFAYGGYSKQTVDSDSDIDLESERNGAQERYNILLSSKKETADQLCKALSDIETLQKENSDLNNKISQLTAKNSELETNIQDIYSASVAAEEAKTTNAFDSFLPPIDENSTEVETINIIQVAKDTANEFLPFAKKAGVNIQVSSATEKLIVKANLQRIRILFRNIIDNSIKYMNREGSMVITLSAIGDDIFIVLKDNGDGLSAAETSHIFEINYQGSNRISGNGLGLTQAKAIVESYGGTIYAKSTLGNGMGIYIQIPVQ